MLCRGCRVLGSFVERHLFVQQCRNLRQAFCLAEQIYNCASDQLPFLGPDDTVRWVSTGQFLARAQQEDTRSTAHEHDAYQQNNKTQA